jgi:hypothetical protein
MVLFTDICLLLSAPNFSIMIDPAVVGAFVGTVPSSGYRRWCFDAMSNCSTLHTGTTRPQRFGFIDYETVPKQHNNKMSVISTALI